MNKRSHVGAGGPRSVSRPPCLVIATAAVVSGWLSFVGAPGVWHAFLAGAAANSRPPSRRRYGRPSNRAVSSEPSAPRDLTGMLDDLPPHPARDASLEQYATDALVAARWLEAIDDKAPFREVDCVADFGAGNGLLGIGALLLGAPRALFVELDDLACDAIHQGLASHGLADRAEVLCTDLRRLEPAGRACDVVMMNPPWGQRGHKRRLADRPFLEMAVKLAKTSVHLLHSAGVSHVEPWANDSGWVAQRWLEAELTLPRSYAHQRKQKAYVDAAMWWLTRRDAPNQRKLQRSHQVISVRSKWAALS